MIENLYTDYKPLKQALKNRIEKERIPSLLCEHIVDICETRKDEKGCMN